MKTSAQPMIEKNRAAGFTLVELAVVLTTLAVLATLMLSAVAATRPNTQSFQCLENQRQVILAWEMYAQDNANLLPPNDYPSNAGGVRDGSLKEWVFGSMAVAIDVLYGDQGGLLPPVPGVNNELVGMNPQLSLLATYNRNPLTYKCPADVILMQNQPRPRSISMNSCVGTRWYSAGLGGGTKAYAGAVPGDPVGGGWSTGTYQDPNGVYRCFGKMTSFTAPGPSGTWIIMDENPYTINDPLLAIAMNQAIVDWPASYHNGGAGISFADGHVEIHRWVDCFLGAVPPGVSPVLPNGFTVKPISVSGPFQDLAWIQPRTTALK